MASKKNRVDPNQISFDDLLWGNKSDQIAEEPKNEHEIKSYQNAQGTKIFCCSKCGMWFTEDELHTGSYDHHCKGYRTYGPSGTPLQEVKWRLEDGDLK